MSFNCARLGLLKLLSVFSIFSCSTSLAQNFDGQYLSDQASTAFFHKCPEARYVNYVTGNTQQNLPSQDIIEDAAATPNSIPAYHGVPRIGVWGDSHTASGDFVVSAIQQWGFQSKSVRPSMIQPAMILAGVKTQLKKSCIKS